MYIWNDINFMDKDILKKAFDLINKSRSMSELFEKEKRLLLNMSMQHLKDMKLFK